jgi:hypothetical protein
MNMKNRNINQSATPPTHSAAYSKAHLSDGEDDDLHLPLIFI